MPPPSTRTSKANLPMSLSFRSAQSSRRPAEEARPRCLFLSYSTFIAAVGAVFTCLVRLPCWMMRGGRFRTFARKPFDKRSHASTMVTQKTSCKVRSTSIIESRPWPNSAEIRVCMERSSSSTIMQTIHGSCGDPKAYTNFLQRLTRGSERRLFCPEVPRFRANNPCQRHRSLRVSASVAGGTAGDRRGELGSVRQGGHRENS